MVVAEDGSLPLPWLEAALNRGLGLQHAHAVLLHAAAGDGALHLALTLAQSWLCEAPAAGVPRPACGRCGACRQVAVRAHPDLKLLLPESLVADLGWGAAESEADGGDTGKAKRKPSRQVRIDAVRAAIDWTSTTSSRGRGKVVLIHPADTLNVQSANALLKTLEEPPQGARLILTTADPEHLLPTVRSRCQRLRLVTPETELAYRWLAGQGMADAEVLLRAMDGHPLDALAQASQGLTATLWNELPRAVQASRTSYFSGWPLPMVIESLLKYAHDAMAVAVGARPRYFDAASFPRGGSLTGLQAWKKDLMRVARHSDHAWSEPLLVEAMLAGARGIGIGAGLDTLRA